MSDDALLDKLDAYVTIEKKVVTYKWLSHALSIPEADSKRLLQKYLTQRLTSSQQQQPEVFATFLIGGFLAQSGSPTSPPSLVLRLVPQSGLAAAERGLETVSHFFVYSLSLSEPVTTTLYISDKESSPSTSFPTSKSTRITSEDAVSRERSVDAKTRGSAKSIQPAVTKSPSGGADAKPTAKSSPGANFFGKAAVKPKAESSDAHSSSVPKAPESPAQKPEPAAKAPEPTTPISSSSKPVAASAEKALGKSAAKPDADKGTPAIKRKRAVDSDDDDDDDTGSAQKTAATPPEQKSAPASAKGKSNATPTVAKAKAKATKPSPVTKKGRMESEAKAANVEDDQDDEDDEDDDDEEEEDRKKRIAVDMMETPNPLQPTPMQVSEPAKKQVWVKRTYVDAKGYSVSERVLRDVDEDAEASETPAPAAAAAPVPPETRPQKNDTPKAAQPTKAAAPAGAAAKGSKPAPKQQSLMSFFKK